MNLKPGDLRDEDWFDPDDPGIYRDVQALQKKIRPGQIDICTCMGLCRIHIRFFLAWSRTLLLMSLEPEYTGMLFRKVSEFSRRVMENMIALGIDVIHITGDVGSNGSMLFSPDMWRQQVKPLDEQIIRPAKEKGIPVSLHSCGYCMPVYTRLDRDGGRRTASYPGVGRYGYV